MHNRKGMELVRYAVHLMDQCNESFNDRFTTEEILRLADACQRSKWDMFPDQWDERQIQECLNFNIVPDWQEQRANEWGGTKLVAVFKQDGQNEYTVSCRMTMTADVSVYADTLKQAIDYAQSNMPLPKNTTYLDDSFEVDQENTEYLNE